MTQEEIIQAISETIVPNNQKGITAESLANLLISMVESSGSGDGALRVFVSSEGSYSPADLEGIDAEFPDYYEAFSALFTHNAGIYAQIVAARDSGEPCPSIVIDEGVMTTLMYKFYYENYPEAMPTQLMGAMAYPAEVMSAKDASGSGLLGEEDGLVTLIPTGSSKEYIPSLTLAEDGGFTIGTADDATDLTMVEVYIPSEYALTDSNKEQNKSIYEALGSSSTIVLGKGIYIRKRTSADTNSYQVPYYNTAVLSHDTTYNSSLGTWDRYMLFLGSDLKIYKCSITSEGEASVSVYAILTAPTAS